MKTMTEEADAVAKYYRDKYGYISVYWPHLEREMNRLTGYGNYCNNTTLEEGMAAVYRSLVASGAIQL